MHIHVLKRARSRSRTHARVCVFPAAIRITIRVSVNESKRAEGERRAGWRGKGGENADSRGSSDKGEPQRVKTWLNEGGQLVSRVPWGVYLRFVVMLRRFPFGEIRPGQREDLWAFAWEMKISGRFLDPRERILYERAIGPSLDLPVPPFLPLSLSNDKGDEEQASKWSTFGPSAWFRGSRQECWGFISDVAKVASLSVSLEPRGDTRRTTWDNDAAY